jgi:ATP-dependent DNA helicase RecQ
VTSDREPDLDPDLDLDRALERLTGRSGASFRPGQREAIESLAIRRERVLLVQRTGWGKSAVYFLATRMLRDAGLGPTLLVSPLLALMRNQLDAASRLGLRAFTINSASATTVNEIGELLERNEVDLLLISPERLANPEFGDKIMPIVGRTPGLIVIDEAHCISDWGHDFRPDYRRLGQMIDGLPGAFPVLGCTATANDRVVEDVASQLGATMNVLRGPLTRDGLALSVIELPDAAERLCWLDRHLADLAGSGVVYCLTVADVMRVTEWLKVRGHTVLAYSGDLDNELRLEAEAALQTNQIKALIATTALGMGYDKPDLGFVIHFQSPGSPVAYYQQVGRAGRALDTSVAVLLRGDEDERIQDWFIQQAFPDEHHVDEVLAVFDAATGPITLAGVEDAVNMKRGTLELVLKQLTVEGVLKRLRAQTYERTLKPWRYPTQRVAGVTAARRAEQQQMRDYAGTTSCRMRFLTRLLDDPAAEPCGVCDVCAPSDRFRGPLDVADVASARQFLQRGFVTIEPRKMLPGRKLDIGLRFETGSALCTFGERGWGALVLEGRRSGTRFDDRLIGSLIAMVTEWAPSPAPAWVTFVPSVRTPGLVADLAHRFGDALGLPVIAALAKARQNPKQKSMQNSAHQYANVDGAFEVIGGMSDLPFFGQPAFLIDDLVDSRWTLTEVARCLRQAGSGPVFPVALATTMGRDS